MASPGMYRRGVPFKRIRQPFGFGVLDLFVFGGSNPHPAVGDMDVTNRVLDHEVWRTVNCHGKKLDKEE